MSVKSIQEARDRHYDAYDRLREHRIQAAKAGHVTFSDGVTLFYNQKQMQEREASKRLPTEEYRLGMAAGLDEALRILGASR